MPSWNDGDESFDDESMGGNLMDMEYFVNLILLPLPLFRVRVQSIWELGLMICTYVWMDSFSLGFGLASA
jgi:hypothetical protein